MIKPQQNFFLSDSKIHTVGSSACVLPPPAHHIYEVFRVISGVPLFVEDHMQRLEHSLSAVNIHADMNAIQLDVKKLMQLNGFATGNIKIIVWQHETTIHTMILYDNHLYPSSEQFMNGIRIGTMQHIRKDPNVKLFDAEMRNIAQSKINEQDFYEILLVTPDGYITEGSRSNIFFIQSDTIITPPSDQVLEGVTRKKVISLIKDNSMHFSERKVHLNELPEFDSIFLTGTSRRVLPVHTIDPFAKQYNTNHQLIRDLQNRFLQLCENYIKSKK